MVTQEVSGVLPAARMVHTAWEGIPNKSTTASLGPVKKTIDDGVSILLVMPAVGMEAVGIYAESIKNKTQHYSWLWFTRPGLRIDNSIPMGKTAHGPGSD